MKTQFYIILLIVLFVSGCGEVVTIEKSSDDLLADAIVGGVWSDGSHSSREYFSNRTFTDKSIFWSINGQPDSLTVVSNGKYAVVDGILYKYDIRTTSSSNSAQGGYSIGWGPSELVVRGDSLWAKGVEVFSRTAGDSSDLNGSWSTILLIAYGDSSSVPIYQGRLKQIYTFFPDSLRVKIERRLLDDPNGSPQALWASYIYNAPLLEIEPRFPVRVSFKDGKMFWYHDNSTSQYTRTR